MKCSRILEEKQMFMFSPSSLTGSPSRESLNILAHSEISLDQVKLNVSAFLWLLFFICLCYQKVL